MEGGESQALRRCLRQVYFDGDGRLTCCQTGSTHGTALWMPVENSEAVWAYSPAKIEYFLDLTAHQILLICHQPFG